MEQPNEVQVPETAYDFSASFTIGTEEHQDFHCISYARLARTTGIAAILVLLCAIPQSFLTPQNAIVAVAASIVFLLMGVVRFLQLRKNIRLSYQRTLLLHGSENTPWQTIRFREKIWAATEPNAPIEYDYSLITSISETQYFYLLGMKLGVFILVHKDMESNLKNISFPDYIFEKCPNIKKKKVQKITNRPARCMLYLCLLAAEFLLTLVMRFYWTVF